MCNSHAKSRVHFAAFHEANSHSTARSWMEKPNKSGKLPTPPWTLVWWVPHIPAAEGKSAVRMG
jgi:hypothetical protein